MWKTSIFINAYLLLGVLYLFLSLKNTDDKTNDNLIDASTIVLVAGGLFTVLFLLLCAWDFVHKRNVEKLNNSSLEIEDINK